MELSVFLLRWGSPIVLNELNAGVDGDTEELAGIFDTHGRFLCRLEFRFFWNFLGFSFCKNADSASVSPIVADGLIVRERMFLINYKNHFYLKLINKKI
jgi:hypothetical protein